MANRKNFHFRQKVTEAELDDAFNDFEVADRAIVTDYALTGILSGATVTEHSPANLTVDVEGPGVIYDKDGQRIRWGSDQVVNLAEDDDAVDTTVPTVGEERWISIFAVFDRALDDPRTDGNGATVFFESAESFLISVVMGAAASTGTATKPALRADAILLADVLRAYGQTTFVNANINTDRREEAVSLSSMATDIATVETAVADVVADVAALSTEPFPSAPKHGDTTVWLGLQMELGADVNNWEAIYAGTAPPALYPFGGNNARWFKYLPLKDGDRLKEVHFYVMRNDTATFTLNVSRASGDFTNGAAAPGVTSIGSPAVGAAASNIQVCSLTGLTYTMVANRPVWVSVLCNGVPTDATDLRFYGVKYVYDRP